MAGDTAFDEFIADEVKRYKGVYVPVKAGMLRRALIRWAPCASLHPNPDDEFCSPKVGPNYRIISEYMNSFRLARHHTKQYCEEPLIVEKIRPDGYLILNGHHRWAAALRLGFSRIPVEIVDLTQEMDIKAILQGSRHDKRVTLDLDEVVFRPLSPALRTGSYFAWKRSRTFSDAARTFLDLMKEHLSEESRL